ncbi:prepilin-type N-terminal cleavage/methylation domain-containing protein [Methylophaga sp. SB9B]|uniref:PilW family protein n=1 Tax=Methylophaga sp. SB9B TaxID=2570356 RepID=UPI0010A88B84|nr:PilW family protein [Methylophaga sp. SB9B]THK41059.1 prepilin-type N-terminal cleavage/methylation domain-containing protein [Methylophaga sp. SB9B]
MTPVKKQQGLSLVELMIAIVLGLILVAGVIELFVNNRQVYRVQDAQSRLQENGRYAMKVITQSIERAGYLGCATRSALNINNILNTPNDYLWNITTPIEGNEATGENQWTPTRDVLITSPTSGSDILTIRTIEPPEMRVVSHPTTGAPGSAAITVNSGNGLALGDIVLAHDCVAGAIFEITSATPNNGTLEHAQGTGTSDTPGNSTATLGYNFGAGWVNKIATNSFYIRTRANANVPSLYLKNGTTDPVEIVEGIESMQVQYGVDTSGNGAADTYQTADQIGNWNNIVSVRISLVMVSVENNLTVDGAQPYNLEGVTVTPGDRRLRRVFTRTVTLRNRVS